MKKEYFYEEVYKFMFKKLGEYSRLSRGLKRAIMERTRIVEFNAGDVIHKRGQVNRFCYFSFSGYVKGVFDGGRKKVTCWYMKTGDIFIWPISFFTQTPSVGSVIAMEYVIAVELSFDDYKWLHQHFPQFRKIDELASKYYYFLTLQREEMKGYSDKENYQRLCEQHPRVIEIEKIEDKSSYLGISRASLIRIRRELKNRIK